MNRPPKSGAPSGVISGLVVSGEVSPALVDARRAEQAGDLGQAIAILDARLKLAPGDNEARLRLARALFDAGDGTTARRVLEAFETPGPSVALGDPWPPRDVLRLVAELDEAEGDLQAAAERWERLLADDIDDPQARAHLRLLRPEPPAPSLPAAAPTLVSPEGIDALRYVLVRELGRGASSAVYLARDEMLGIEVALKILHPQHAAPARADARRRFFAEARLAATLRHPGVVAVYDLDEATRTLVMEYVPGGTLRARLRGDRPTLDETLATARSLLDALAYVHRRGIVHGDVKPSNLLLRAPGQVVLADFGVAELLRPEDANAAATAAAERPAGTPLYLAPEQFRGAPSSARTDLFAAGAIFWEMIVGRPMRRQADLIEAPDRVPLVPEGYLEALGTGARKLAALVAALTRSAPSDRPSTAENALRLL